MTSNTIFSYNLENVNQESVKKEVKLISFEDILSPSSIKQWGNPQIESRQIKEQFKLEADAENLTNFQYKEANISKLSEKIRKFNDNRINSGKSFTVLLNQEDDKLYVKSSQLSEKLSEKMIENIRTNHEVTSPKKSEGINSKQNETPLKINGGGLIENLNVELVNSESKINDGNKENPVISLVRFLKKVDSKKYFFIFFNM